MSDSYLFSGRNKLARQTQHSEKLINAAIGLYNELRSIIIIIGLSDIEAFLIIIAWFAFTERKPKT